MAKIQSRKEIDGIIDPKTYGGFDKFMDRARKVAKYILPVLGATFMAGCNAEMLDAIARTAQAPEVSVQPSDFTAPPGEVVVEMPSLTPEPTAPATEIPEPTATATEIPSAIEKEDLEEKHIFLSEKIGYGDYQFDFNISLLNDDEIIKASFEKYGIESVSINEEKIGARELLAKGIIYSFVETYNLQNGTNVSMDEYMANPTNYPSMIKVLGDDGKQVVESITIDQIKKIDLRYTGGMDGELYMSSGGPLGSGFRLEDGTLIMYTFFSTRDPQLLYLTEYKDEFGDDVLPSFYGYFIVSSLLEQGLAEMQLTTVPLVERTSERWLEVYESIRIVTETKRSSPSKGEVFHTWMREHGSLFVVNRN